MPEKTSSGLLKRLMTGYEKDGRIYDKNWNLQGYKKKSDTIRIYDKQPSKK